MASESLDKLNSNYKEAKSFIEIQDKKSLLLEVKAIILAAAFLIFQGNLYAHLNIPSSLPGTSSISVCLSTLVSIAFWLAFVPTIKGCMRLKRQQDSTFIEQESVYRKIFSIQTGRKQSDDAARQTLANSFKFVRCQRYAYVWVQLFALFFFTVLVTYALFAIPPSRKV